MLAHQKLEQEFAQFTGRKYAVAVNSGTSALHLSLVALGIGPGDEVIVPDFTMAACAFAVSYTGASPVFVDCGIDLNIDVSLIEKAITKRTKAIMPVHVYGRMADMKGINRIARKHKLKIVEDACEVHGANTGKADLTCYSFYKNKIIHAEEGGIVVTDNKVLYDSMQDLKSMAFGKKHTYFHERIGFNYRMPESQAKLALKSLKNATRNLERRRKVESYYDWYLPSGIERKGGREVAWVYDFMHTNKDETVERLFSQGARHFFKPLSSFPMYGGVAQSPQAEIYSKYGMYLPIYPEMTQKQVQKLCKQIS